MKLLVWNCHGLASARAVRALLDLQKSHKPDVIFLSESHLGRVMAEKLKRRVGFDNFEIHESDGRSGGLLLLWKKEVTIVAHNVSRFFIDVTFEMESSWRFTGFYGEPNWERRADSWVQLRNLHGMMSKPWLVAGDFNEILYNFEKEGGRPRPQSNMQAFHDALVDCDLSDMGYEGDLFTWQRGKMRERLDRGVVNAAWSQFFPSATLVNGEMSKSDHRPLIINTDGAEVALGGLRRKQFEARWLSEEMVAEIVHAAWQRAAMHGQGPTFMQKTRSVHEELHTWDKETLKAPVKRMKKLKKDLERVRRSPLTDENLFLQKELLLKIEVSLEQEEMYWVQRARANWLKHGDRNSSFFQNFATNRRRKNLIKYLIDDQGVKHEDAEGMQHTVQDYFQSLYQSEVSSVPPEMLSDVGRRVTPEMNDELMAAFTREEVRNALFSIGDLKAPGPDGLHAIFYKCFWNMLGGDLEDEVLQAVNSATIPEGWNDTTIVLIPKVTNPEKITQFRPISLCNVVYKVISKLLANRLKRILPDIVSPFQSAFVPGRLITDNILVAYESIHSIKKKQGKKGVCAVKLDMHKAYDHVEWIYLKEIMLKMGFSQQWVNIIMSWLHQ